LAAHSAELARLKTTVLGADRYCHAPFGRAWRAQGLDFMRVCTPSAHATVDAWRASLARHGAVRTVTRPRWTGRRRATDTYRDADAALAVNGCARVTPDDDSSQVGYRNAFATRLALDDGNVAAVVATGRSRGKIENEHHNTLKTQGYPVAHQFGHGQQHRSALLASRIRLACQTHTVLAWMDGTYPRLRQPLPSRKHLFNDIRSLTSDRCFDSWEALMDGMLASFEPVPAQPETGGCGHHEKCCLSNET
jgi:hypothetical protein